MGSLPIRVDLLENWEEKPQLDRFKFFESLSLTQLQALTVSVTKDLLLWVETQDGLKTVMDRIHIQEGETEEEVQAKFLTLAVFISGLTNHLETPEKLKSLTAILHKMLPALPEATKAVGMSKFINVFSSGWNEYDLTQLFEEIQKFSNIPQDSEAEDRDEQARRFYRSMYINGAPLHRRVFWLKKILDVHAPEESARVIFTLFGPATEDTGAILWKCPEETIMNVHLLTMTLHELTEVIANIDATSFPNFDSTIKDLLVMMELNWGVNAEVIVASQAGRRPMELLMLRCLEDGGIHKISMIAETMVYYLLIQEDDGEAFGDAVGNVLCTIECKNLRRQTLRGIVETMKNIVRRQEGNIPRHMFRMFVKMSCQWTARLLIKKLVK